MVLAIALIVPLVCATETIRGVSPYNQSLYSPLPEDDTKWSCLNDSSKVLDYSSINDGICDCPDGSDEPGTNACEQRTLFYCHNEGFLPRSILNYKVNDGVCDCCDCSDEYLREPFSRGKSCSDLNDELEQILSMELDNYRAGVTALKKLQSDTRADSDNLDNAESEKLHLDGLTKYSSDLKIALSKTQEALDKVQKSYRDKLFDESPQLFEYENLRVDWITDSITSVFSHSQVLSNAFNELRLILNNLYENYNRKLNDKVVTRNMKRFADLEKSFRESFQPDGRLDITQRDQINDFLNDELPTFLFEGKTKYTPEIMVAKSQFVKRIINVQMKTKDLTLDGIKQFQELSNDIITNHDINFQDGAVKSFTETYMTFMSKYEESLHRIDFPDDFVDTFTKLLEFVAREAPNVEVDSDVSNSNQGMMQYVQGAFDRLNFFSPSLQSYKSQIKVLKEQTVGLAKKLRTNEKQIRELKQKLEVQIGDTSGENLVYKQVGSLLNGLKDFCTLSELNSYVYKLCYSNDNGGKIVQIESKPGGSEVVVGHYTGFEIDTDSKHENYLESLKYRYPDTEVGRHLLSDTVEIGKEEVMLGNLPDLNNGLKLEYRRGDRCWNGPLRSAKIQMRCAPEFKIEAVSEPTRCSYVFEMAGPLGCDPSFNFQISNQPLL
ncbi:unnamed protein product [Kluyveromyces dobzhanskii CBS 2104]|uniref:Glucosidase 2 subunit beta n=1 Tax=Kluyveromyces dobzhanskii CBS 2104 TaxID=1427455 RepID=A0A0A8LAA3_9SACH|nr:unnamed protein product [Kluyveromyces dobzhanskii CBS 2104]